MIGSVSDHHVVEYHVKESLRWAATGGHTGLGDERRDVMPDRLVRHGSAPYGTVSLDALDRRIIQLLRYDGRRTYADIARIGGVSEPTVRKRVDRLVRTGAIYVVARVNPAAIGFAIDAMVGIRVKRGTVQDVGTRLAAMENVAYVGYMTGGFDIFIEVFLPDTEGLFTFLNIDLAEIEEITHAEAWHVLRTEKFSYTWEGETVPTAALTTPQHEGAGTGAEDDREQERERQ